jgi:tetrahydromethanopterin S-methyltransferase subunit B
LSRFRYRTDTEGAAMHLAEECAELAAVIAKTLYHGWFNYDPTTKVREFNMDMILREMQDVEARIAEMREHIKPLALGDTLDPRHPNYIPF